MQVLYGQGWEVDTAWGKAEYSILLEAFISLCKIANGALTSAKLFWEKSVIYPKAVKVSISKLDM